ncbi:glutathione peroxidase [Streptococcus suis]|uniref:glutathione peroxidase n=1 Tax=Streptococcus suis TaxID=1307 RepID=UPI0038B81C27
MSIYDFTVQKQDGTDQSMAEYQGQVLLIVNTAPGCGLDPNTRNYRGSGKELD